MLGVLTGVFRGQAQLGASPSSACGDSGSLTLSTLASFLGSSPALLSTSCCCWVQEGHRTGGSLLSIQSGWCVCVRVCVAIRLTPAHHPASLRVARGPGPVQGRVDRAAVLSPLAFGAQVPGVGRPRPGSAFTTTPTGSWSAPTRAAWSAARASRTSGCTATPPGATARAPSSSSRRAAGWTTSTAMTGALEPGLPYPPPPAPQSRRSPPVAAVLTGPRDVCESKPGI